jgi:hypothetical protein
LLLLRKSSFPGRAYIIPSRQKVKAKSQQYLFTPQSKHSTLLAYGDQKEIAPTKVFNDLAKTPHGNPQPVM